MSARVRGKGIASRFRAAVQDAMGATSTGGYKGAEVNRLLTDWILTSVSVDEEMRTNLRVLRSRARDLAKNNPFVRKYLSAISAKVVGPMGPSLDARNLGPTGEMNERANKAIEAAWREFACGPVTLDGRMDLPEVQRLVVESAAGDGEIFVREWRGGPADRVNKFGYALELIDADLVDETYWRKAQRSQGVNEVRLGVEENEFGQSVGFHVIEGRDEFTSDRRRVFVDAREMFQVMRPHRVMQTRGLPWVHPVMYLLKMLDGYFEAEVVAARASASKMGWFTKKDASSLSVPANEDRMMEANPGSIDYAPEGYEFVPWDPVHPAGTFDPFTKAVLRAIFTGLGIPYATGSGDLSSVNYSSMKFGEEDYHDLIRMLHSWFTFQFCRRTYSSWLEMGILNNAIAVGGTSDPRAYQMALWTPRGFEYVDPNKDATADELMLSIGMESVQHLQRERGRDWKKVLEEQAEAEKYAKALGLDISPKKIAAGANAGAKANANPKADDGTDQAEGDGEGGDGGSAEGRARSNGHAHPSRLGALVGRRA